MEKVKEVAKAMIEKTKDAVREVEREQELRQKFEEIFGFQPEKIWWTCYQTLKAKTQVSRNKLSDEENTIEWKIEGKKVVEVVFWLIEESSDVGQHDIDWKFEKSQAGFVFRYCWTKKLRKFIAVVEIMTRD